MKWALNDSIALNDCKLEPLNVELMGSRLALRQSVIARTWPQAALKDLWSRPGDLFIRKAVLEQGYLASQVAKVLACHPSNVSRALQK